jgi:hypothetical protein
MQLIQIDPLQLQPLQTVVDALRQIFGPAIRHPLPGARPGVPALRRNQQSFRIRMERFGDEQFVNLRAIGIGGVDEIHAQLEGSAQDLLRFLAVRRPSPDPLAR